MYFLKKGYIMNLGIDKEMVQTIMLSHYKRIDLALFICYFYSRNRVGIGGGVNGKYDSSKSR